MKNTDFKTVNFLFAGVGGQGVLLASDILSEAAHIANYDVKKSDIHGMSQRGGSVISQVRFGKKVYSPIIKDREVDFLIGFEILETLRCLNMLAKDAKIIVNNQKIYPISIYSSLPPFSKGGEGGFSDRNIYPENGFELIKKGFKDAELIQGIMLAESAGDNKTVNLVLLGRLSNYLPFEQNVWEGVIKRSVPPSTVERNIHAFRLGKRSK
ncbi:MAG: indolepyruvate oxidoreductase subunit beta [Nitrospirota bacterium]